ncbi:DNA cytosine methyltransferase [Dermabacteraceae bacterium TAE3-ERU5]|nr:DNA cytosine methyltransferase [Dermabacteraceae bacterium TAE3-ERU5]
MKKELTSVELCAGGGGQALGIEQAGFKHIAAIEIDHWACQTLRINRNHENLPIEARWNVVEQDLNTVNGRDYKGVSLIAGGVPCPPFSIAGKQLGPNDDRDLFPKALEIVRDAEPEAVMLENVKGLSQPRFKNYRAHVIATLESMGYRTSWKLINASDFGLAQLRPRFILVALKPEAMSRFRWPTPTGTRTSVGEALLPLMEQNGWPHAREWAQRAQGIGPTLVGGSKKHGGPDLGPTRAREAWRKLHVKGSSIAEEAPSRNAPRDEMPRLTVQMGAKLQGFPQDWEFAGGKTAAWRQVGNAFPPPVAKAIATAIKASITTD